MGQEPSPSGTPITSPSAESISCRLVPGGSSPRQIISLTGRSSGGGSLPAFSSLPLDSQLPSRQITMRIRVRSTAYMRTWCAIRAVAFSTRDSTFLTPPVWRSPEQVNTERRVMSVASRVRLQRIWDWSRTLQLRNGSKSSFGPKPSTYSTTLSFQMAATAA